MAPLVHFRMPSAFLYTLRLAQPAIEKRVLRAAEQDGQAGGQELGFGVSGLYRGFGGKIC